MHYFINNRLDFRRPPTFGNVYHLAAAAQVAVSSETNPTDHTNSQNGIIADTENGPVARSDKIYSNTDNTRHYPHKLQATHVQKLICKFLHGLKSHGAASILMFIQLQPRLSD